MPNVRDSSGTIGTTRVPICLSRSSVFSTRTKAIVVEISRSPVSFSCAPKADSGGTSSASAVRRRGGQAAAERVAPLVQVAHLRAVGRRDVERGLRDLLRRQVEAEALPERRQRALRHLLLLMGDVLALAGLPHPVALDRLGEDHGGLAGLRDRRGVGGVHLDGVVAAAVQRPDVGVGPVLDHRLGLRVAPEEVLAHVGAVARLEHLVLAVDDLVHQAHERAVAVRGQERVPARAPDHLDDVPAGAAEDGLQLLDDLAVAAHRTVQALQVAVDDEDEVVELLAARHRDRAQRLGLVRLAVAEEGPHLAPGGVGDAAALEVLHEAGLVDRRQRAEPHRHRGELPEVRHQPRVRVGGDALAVEPPGVVDLLAEAQQLRLRQPSLQQRARVEARRGVALHEHEVAAVVLRRRVPEVVEADLVERGRRLVAGDVAAELRGLLVGLEHRRHRVPADQVADLPLDRRIARIGRVRRRRDRVHVRGGARQRRRGAHTARLLHDPLHEEARTVRPVRAHDRVQRVDPLAGLVGVDVGDRLPVAFQRCHVCFLHLGGARPPAPRTSTDRRRAALAAPAGRDPTCPCRR